MFRYVVFVVVAAAVFVAATSNEVYVIASPPELAWHTILRKAESIVGFAVVALLGAWCLGRRPNRALILILGGLAYSAAIEAAQYAQGSLEGRRMEAFDIFCGGVGGALAALIVRLVG